MKSNIYRALSVFLILIFCFTLYAPCVSAADIDAQIAAKQKEIEEKEAELAAIQSDKSKEESYIAKLNEQIDDMEAQLLLIGNKVDKINADIGKTNEKIEVKTQQIDEKTKSITKIETDIEGKQNEIDETIKLLCKRLRAAYMAGSSSTLEILLSCEDIASFLTTSEMLKRVAEYDDALINELYDRIDDLDVMKTDLVKERSALQETKAELDKEKAGLEEKLVVQEAEQAVYQTQQDEIANKISESQAILSKLDKQSAEYMALIAQFEAEEQALQAEKQSFIQSATGGGSSSGGLSGGSSSSGGYDNSYDVNTSGGFICPVPYSSAYISSYYGYRDSFVTDNGNYASSNHSGLDITCNGASNYDKSIVAAKAGTVILAQYYYGYGNTVIIDHGGGYTTLYGHNDSLAVYVGQYVSQGQHIAIMGNTGNSSGPHCHFEIMINGSTVNPLGYISVP